MNSRPQTASSLRANVLTSTEEFRNVAPEWKALFLRCPDATPFQHPEWLLAWMEAFSPRELFGIEVREGTRLVGFAPLLIYSRDGERVLAFAAGGISDYLNFLVEPGREASVVNAVIETALTIPDWTICDITDLPGNSALLNSGDLHRRAQKHDLCYVLSLPQTTEQLIQSLTKRQWANLRNARSKTQREGGAKLEVAETATLSEFLDDLFRLHRTRWVERGEDGVLDDARVQHFHRNVAPALLSDGLLHLHRMRLDDSTIAVIYSLVHGETAFCYLQGFDPQYSHLSPGTQLMFAVIEDAVRLGLRRFDFLRGEESYKLHWKPQGEPTYRIEVPRQWLSEQFHKLAA